MHTSMHRRQCGDFIYYTCDRLPVCHAFTTKSGGVSTGDCESLNLGFARGDDPACVRENYAILARALEIPKDRITLTQQVHSDQVAAVTAETVGAGLIKPTDWTVDALVTTLPDTPIAGFYADCVVTLFYDPSAHVCGVCHAGWRGTAKEIAAKTVSKMIENGATPEHIIAVIGPSICQSCFETDVDVPSAMRAQMGATVEAHILKKGVKFHVDLQSIQADTLRRAGLHPDNIINSGICTKCQSDIFWSHRATNGKRGVQAGVICL